jgi:hypothetical protein
MKNTTLTSPAHTTLLKFLVLDRDSVEIIRTDWNGGLPAHINREVAACRRGGQLPSPPNPSRLERNPRGLRSLTPDP